MIKNNMKFCINKILDKNSVFFKPFTILRIKTKNILLIKYY